MMCDFERKINFTSWSASNGEQCSSTQFSHIYQNQVDYKFIYLPIGACCQPLALRVNEFRRTHFQVAEQERRLPHFLRPSGPASVAAAGMDCRFGSIDWQKRRVDACTFPTKTLGSEIESCPPLFWTRIERTCVS